MKIKLSSEILQDEKISVRINIVYRHVFLLKKTCLFKSMENSKGKNKEKYDYCSIPMHSERYFLPKITTRRYN
jgi:hypothetical protein